MSDTRAPNHRADWLRFDAWPPELQTLFDGRALDRLPGFTASLVTYQDDGRIGTSLLSLGELYVPGPRALRLALWARARAAQALASGAPAALTFVFDGAFNQIQLTAVTPIASAQAAAGGLACFESTIASGEAQRVPYARLDAGIAFTLDEAQRDAALRRWSDQIEWLKAARA